MAEQQAEVWTISYRIKRVNGQLYDKDPERIRAYEEQIPNLLKEGAEKLSDRADFPAVEMTAKSETTGKEHQYLHLADTGFSSDWVTGKQ